MGLLDNYELVEYWDLAIKQRMNDGTFQNELYHATIKWFTENDFEGIVIHRGSKTLFKIRSGVARNGPDSGTISFQTVADDHSIKDFHGDILDAFSIYGYCTSEDGPQQDHAKNRWSAFRDRKICHEDDDVGYEVVCPYCKQVLAKLDEDGCSDSEDESNPCEDLIGEGLDSEFEFKKGFDIFNEIMNLYSEIKDSKDIDAYIRQLTGVDFHADLSLWEFLEALPEVTLTSHEWSSSPGSSGVLSYVTVDRKSQDKFLKKLTNIQDYLKMTEFRERMMKLNEKTGKRIHYIGCGSYDFSLPVPPPEEENEFPVESKELDKPEKSDGMTAKSISKGETIDSQVIQNVTQGEQSPFFKGYPYLAIRITRVFYHINLLSSMQNNTEDLYRLAQTQADANKLQVCLVISENSGMYFSHNAKPIFSEQIPKGIFITDRLRLSMEQPVDADLIRRKVELDAFIEKTKGRGYLIGDLNKGARKATEEEIISLQGVQENGLPKGLMICPVCGDYQGECLDPGLIQKTMVRVFCYCENDNLCAYCGGKLSDRKLNSNRYEPKERKIWYRPGFSGLDHRCPEESNNV